MMEKGQYTLASNEEVSVNSQPEVTDPRRKHAEMFECRGKYNTDQ